MKTILGVVAFLLAFALFKYLGLVGLLFVGAYYLGDWLGKWYMKRNNPNTKLTSFMSWLNLLTWFLPPLGIFNASLAYGFSKSEKIGKSNKYRNLA